MSYATVKALWPGEKVESLKEFRNQYWGAFCIWNELGQRYLALEAHMVLRHTDRLWPLWKDLSIPRHHRAVLTMTYDRIFIARGDYARAAEDIRQFIQDFPAVADSIDSHWPQLLSLLESNPTCPAIGFQWSSVSEDLFTGPWNDDTNDNDPLNWSAFYDMYAELDHHHTEEL